MTVVVTTGAMRRAKLQSNSRQQQTNTNYLTGRMLFLSPSYSVKALKRESITFRGLAHPKLTWGSSILVLTTKAPGYFGGVLSSLSSAL